MSFTQFLSAHQGEKSIIVKNKYYQGEIKEKSKIVKESIIRIIFCTTSSEKSIIVKKKVTSFSYQAEIK